MSDSFKNQFSRNIVHNFHMTNAGGQNKMDDAILGFLVRLQEAENIAAADGHFRQRAHLHDGTMDSCG